MMAIPRAQHTVASPTTESESQAATGDSTVTTPPRGRPDGTSGRERTRTSKAFNSLIAGVVVLILLLVFILENTQSVKISYFGATGHISLGVALLVATVGGALLVGLAGAARVVQLRHRIKHSRD